MAFILIQDDILYLKVISDGGGKWVDRVWVPDPPLSYTTFEATWEPYQMGEEMIALPAGVSSSDAIIVYSDYSLNTADSEEPDTTIADIIYLTDPLTTNARAYEIQAKANWQMNQSFQLFDSYGEYLAVRKRAD